MGREQTQKRQFFLLYIACCLMIVFVGGMACCHLPLDRQSKNEIDEVQRAISNGDFEVALKHVDGILGSVQHSNTDEVLYIKGLICMHPKNPKKSPSNAFDSFQTLYQKYPDSPWRESAEIWISALETMRCSREKLKTLEKANKEKEAEIEMLQTQIDALKKIDLGTEENKRRQLFQ